MKKLLRKHKKRIMKHLYRFHQVHGGAMITTMLILMAIMLGFLLSGLFSSVREKEVLVDSDRISVADQAANACAEIAIDRLGRDETYAGSQVLDIDAGISCTIRPVLFATTWTIETTATVDGRTANYRIVLNGRNPVDISSWQKVASF